MVDIQLSDAEKTYIIHGAQDYLFPTFGNVNTCFQILTFIGQQKIKPAITDNLRLDGRGCEDYRHLEIETNVVSNTSGSAKIRLANTEILVGVKAELGQPLPENPDKGRLEFFVDCSANATPEFEGRGGEELATEISSMLSRAYDCPSCLDLKQLCVVEGKQCWVIYIDILLLECGGNLFDAASVAVKAALYNTCIPTLTVTQDEGHIELELSDDPYDVQRLDVTHAPCIVTLSKIGHSHVVDASQKEEACCLARLMLGVTDKGTVTAMKKEGSGSLDASSVEDMLETGRRVGQALNKSLMEVLLSDEKVGKKKIMTGFLR